jgi:hypothetical protein
MQGRYDFRAEHLEATDYLKVECQSCGHVERLTGSMLATAGINPTHRIEDLARRLRCRECDAKGRVIVTVFSAHARC